MLKQQAITKIETAEQSKTILTNYKAYSAVFYEAADQDDFERCERLLVMGGRMADEYGELIKAQD